MADALEFMKWPLLACLILPGLLVYLGLHVIEREIIFVDLALAQMSALGISVCVMLGHEAREVHTYFWSVGFTLVGAVLFSLTRGSRRHRVPQEALIGIVYVVAAAASILLLSRNSEGNEELRRTLVGDVLLVRPIQILRTFGVYAAIAVVHYIFRKQFLAISFRSKESEARGFSVRGWDFLFYALFGLVVTSFVQIGGVLLVFSYLIVPGVCATFISTKLMPRLLIGWALATLASVAGIWTSFKFDLPTGAAIVCSLGVCLVVIGVGSALRGRRVAEGVKPSE